LDGFAQTINRFAKNSILNNKYRNWQYSWWLLAELFTNEIRK
jgi:hypothetical protein